MKSKIRLSLAVVSTLVLFGCAKKSTEPAITVTVLYPQKQDAKFDWQYYSEKHVPLVNGFGGESLLSVQIERGLGGGQKGSPAPFVAIATLKFSSIESFEKAIGPHVSEIMADIPKFTNIEPVIQVSEWRQAK